MNGVISAVQSGSVRNSKKISGLIEAQENIAAFKVVTITGYIANSANVFHKNIIAGIALEAVSTGFNIKVIKEGEITNPSWTWTKGDKIYLNGTALSTTPPTGSGNVVTMIGKAISTTKIDVKIFPSVLLS